MSCVIHPWYYLASGWLRGVDVMAAATLGTGNAPAYGVRTVPVLWRGCKSFCERAQC